MSSWAESSHLSLVQSRFHFSFVKRQRDFFSQTGILLWQHKLLDAAPKLQASLVESDKGFLLSLIPIWTKQIICDRY